MYKSTIWKGEKPLHDGMPLLQQNTSQINGLCIKRVSIYILFIRKVSFILQVVKMDYRLCLNNFEAFTQYQARHITIVFSE